MISWKSLFGAALAPFVFSNAAAAQSPPERASVVTSPNDLPSRHDRPWIFLGGSIDMGNARDWQAELIDALGSEEVVLLNPRRPDWNRAWRADADEPEFRKQVDWELAALENSDVIILYLVPGSQSPISLLEFGLHARSGKLIVLCPPGYWRKGNVDITARRYGVEQVQDLAGLVRAVRKRLRALHGKPLADE